MTSPNQGLLSSLPFQAGITTRQISAENPTGGKGQACSWDPNPEDPFLPHSGPAMDLGKGWKVHPFLRVKAGETAELANITGPGCINQFWITSDFALYRALVLRFYWDGETQPSIEVPLGDFFAMGHDASPHLVNSAPVVVGPYRACNSYWQMPFRKHARITLQNEGSQDANVVAYKVLYKLYDLPDEVPYFHAQWRRSITRRDHPEHIIVDGIKGKGVYVGTYLAWLAFSQGWWGEGEVKFFLDGDTDQPTLADNGTEDYFGGAWCFYKDPHTGPEQVFNTAYCGLPLACVNDPQGPRRFSLYRWHLQDSIGFSEDLRVTVQALGWWPNQKYEPLTDDISSVAYWYQVEPHVAFPSFPKVSERWGR
jgi:hypothetical protein